MDNCIQVITDTGLATLVAVLNNVVSYLNNVKQQQVRFDTKQFLTTTGRAAIGALIGALTSANTTGALIGAMCGNKTLKLLGTTVIKTQKTSE